MSQHIREALDRVRAGRPAGDVAALAEGAAAHLSALERERKAKRVKLVEIAGRLERIGPDSKYALRKRTRRGFARGAIVLRALDVFCDALKAADSLSYGRSDRIVSAASALRKAVRDSA